MYAYEIKPQLQRILKKLVKKDNRAYNQVMNKIEEVINSSDVEHYKNLMCDMRDQKRVHIGHFVLIFQYDRQANLISFEDFDHNDNIYKRKGFKSVT